MPAISLPSPKNAEFAPNALIQPMSDFVRGADDAWEGVARSPLSHIQIFERYAFLISAVPAVSMPLGLVLAGKIGFGTALFHIVLGYLVAIDFLYGASYGVFLLAPLFGGKASPDGAAKLVIYSMIPIYVLSIFLLVPPLKMGAVAGLFGLYLFYRGIPVVARIPEDKHLTFFGANIVCWMIGLEAIRNLLF